MGLLSLKKWTDYQSLNWNDLKQWFNISASTVSTKYQLQRNSKDLGYEPRALTQRTGVMKPQCHHIILSTSKESADLSVSLHNWRAVGIKDVILRGMRKCYPRPPKADRRNQLERGPNHRRLHSQARQSTTICQAASDIITSTCDWCVHSPLVRISKRVGVHFIVTQTLQEMDWDSAPGSEMSQNWLLMAQWVG